MKRLLAIFALSMGILAAANASLAAQIDKETITKTLPSYAKKADMQFSVAPHGHMLMAFPNADDTAVEFYSYTALDKQWFPRESMPTDTVEGATRQTISDLHILAPDDDPNTSYPNSFTISWTSEYFSASETSLGKKFHLYEVSEGYRSAGKIDTPHSTENDDTSGLHSNDTDIRVMRTWLSGFYTFWMEDDGVYYGQHYSASDDWDESRPGALSQVVDSETYFPIFYKLEEAVIGNAGGDVKFGVLQNGCCVSEQVDFSTILTVAEDAELLDVTEGNDGNFHVLYSKYKSGSSRWINIYHKIVSMKDMSVSNEEVALSQINTVFLDASRPLSIDTVFNRYGDGQYIVTVRYDKRILGYAMRNAFGWNRGELFKRTYFTVSLPQIRAGENGKIQYVWSHNGKRYTKTYNSKTKKWSDVQRLRKKYGSRRLVNPIKNTPPAVYDNSAYEVLRTLGKKKKRIQIVRKWGIGDTLRSAPAYRLPKGYKRIYHSVDGDTHFIILKKGKRLKSIIETDSALFGS